jgi:hypothetical protein
MNLENKRGGSFMKNKLILSLVFVLSLISILSNGSAKASYFTDNSVLLQINDKYLVYSKYSMPRIDKNKRIVVPLRLINDALVNSKINWNNISKSVELDSPNFKLKGKLGGSSVQINGKEINSDTSFDVINGTTMVPIKWIAEGLGAELKYDTETHVLSIKHKHFFEAGSKLEKINDADNIPENNTLSLIPQNISYKYSKVDNYNYLNFTILNNSDQILKNVEDHLYCYIDKENEFSLGTRGYPMGDSSKIQSIDSFAPHEFYTYQMNINELHNIGGTKKPCEYAFIQFYIVQSAQ